MNIVIIHGQAHKGSTYHITELLANQIVSKEDIVKDFRVNNVLPCVGCFNCIIRDEHKCPHRDIVGPIIEAIEGSDIVVINSPNYCMGMTGQLKSLFDHMGYRWMSHRPHPLMKDKIGICISTTAGIGANKVTKQIKQQMFWWGMSKIYTIPFAVAAMSWEEVNSKKQVKIQTKVTKIARKINNKPTNVRRGLQSKITYTIMKLQQKNNTWNQLDHEYWKDNGWLS